MPVVEEIVFPICLSYSYKCTNSANSFSGKSLQLLPPNGRFFRLKYTKWEGNWKEGDGREGTPRKKSWLRACAPTTFWPWGQSHPWSRRLCFQTNANGPKGCGFTRKGIYSDEKQKSIKCIECHWMGTCYLLPRGSLKANADMTHRSLPLSSSVLCATLTVF